MSVGFLRAGSRIDPQWVRRPDSRGPEEGKHGGIVSNENRRYAAAFLVLALTGILMPLLGAVVKEVYPDNSQYWTGKVERRVLYTGTTYHKHDDELAFGREPLDCHSDWQAWAKFNLAEIPDSCVVKAAVFRYYVFSSTSKPPRTAIRILASDPVPMSAESLWRQTGSGNVVASDTPPATGWIERQLNAAGVAALQSALGRNWLALSIHKPDNVTALARAHGHANPTYRPALRITFAVRDLAVKEIVAPGGSIQTGQNVTPTVVVENPGEVSAPGRVWFMVARENQEQYRQYLEIPSLAAGAETTLYFVEYNVGMVAGEQLARCSLEVHGDFDPRNNQALNWFHVYAGSTPPLHWGWEEVASLPLLPSARAVKAGGWLAADGASNTAYAGKGNRTAEFYGYDPVRNRWTNLKPIPEAANGKLPGKGAEGVSDGNGRIYLVPGNGKFDFMCYDAATDSWQRLADVPQGPSRKGIKGGTGLAYVENQGIGYVYLLKGPKTDFLRFNTAANAWETLDDAPAGTKPKWDKGSWLVHDQGTRLYAHKAKQHELWVYNLETGAWDGTCLEGMPFSGSLMRVKKSKDGGSAAWFGDGIYGLKGGNTQEFWKFTPATGAWTELETMPACGTTGRRVKVKSGADFVSYPAGRAFYALKGGRTVEFWRYRLAPEACGSQLMSGRSGAMSGSRQPAVTGTLEAPSPLAAGLVRLHCSLPIAGPASVTVHDLTGRSVLRQALRLGRGASSILLDLRNLSSGVYLVRLEADGFSTTRKLVVEH